jgi:hypothetical protein
MIAGRPVYSEVAAGYRDPEEVETEEDALVESARRVLVCARGAGQAR